MGRVASAINCGYMDPLTRHTVRGGGNPPPECSGGLGDLWTGTGDRGGLAPGLVAEATAQHSKVPCHAMPCERQLYFGAARVSANSFRETELNCLSRPGTYGNGEEEVTL